LRGYQKDGVVDAIREAGGEIFAVTSEPHSLARNAQESWGTGFDHIGDPHQEVLGECVDHGWLSLFVNDWGEDFIAGIPWVSHPRGYFQPGVLALGRNARVLYRWRCRPTHKNIGGALERPAATHVWKSVQVALAEPADAPDVAPDDDPVLDSKAVPWLVFVMLLLANGWFLKPVGFDERARGPSVVDRQRNAMLRIPIFIAAWLALFAVLPIWGSVLALAGWIAKITPGVRMVNMRFQNVGPNEEPV
jgi:hypothetical protein